MKHGLVSESDGRSSIHKCRRIIYGLREFYEQDDLIPWMDLEYFIQQICGIFPRTTHKYAEILVELKYLEPIGRRVRDVTVKPTSSYGMRTYSKKGVWRRYRFGVKAPKRYVETLNPKYVPPKTPLPRVDEGQRLNNIRTLSRGKRVENGDVEGDVKASKDAIVGDREERECRARTHISDTAVTLREKNADLKTFQENEAAEKPSPTVIPMTPTSKNVTAMTPKNIAFIVDYDIPEKPASSHRSFYRRLSKLKQRYGYDGKSSLSVLKTYDRELAFKIYELALAYDGEANVWQAVNLTRRRRKLENGESWAARQVFRRGP